MTEIINYIIESSFILFVFYLIYYVLFRYEKCYVFNRYYLLSIAIIAMILPTIELDFLEIPNTLSIGSFNTVYLQNFEFTDNKVFHTGSNWTIYNTIGIIYLIISSTLLILFIRKLVEIWSIYKAGLPQVFRSINIIRVKEKDLVFTFFRDIYISENESITDDILAHEEVHSKELHSIDILIYEILTIIFWFNPIIHLLKYSIKLNHEFIADEASTSPNQRASYISSLANYHLKQVGLSIGSHFGKPSILTRIKMINKQNNKTMKIKFIIPALALVAMFTLFCCEEQYELSNTTEPIAPALVIDVEAPPFPDSYNSEPIYDVVQQGPVPSGGMTAFYKWVNQTMIYPENARKEGHEGRVFIQFIIDKEGNLQEATVLKGNYQELNEEALRVIRMSKHWSVGLHEGKPVNVKLILPITFKLS